MNLLPIPWMKQKLEVIYEKKLYGNLYLMYNDLNSKNFTDTSTTFLLDLLDNYNINPCQNNALYLYLPIEVDSFIKNLILSFKSLFKENIYIVLGGYLKNNTSPNELDHIADLYTQFPQLNGLIDFAYIIDDSKCYEIFTSLCDTQRISINPATSCTISGPTLNYHIKSPNPNDIDHISFINLMDDITANNYFDTYLKGLTNNNNNFNFNL
jgi:D-serine dehydratase